MLARLGDVLYWAACAVAVLCAALFVFLAVAGSDAKYFGMFVVGGFGATTWVFGRACKYVLAGK
jgi:hypothetical protein